MRACVRAYVCVFVRLCVCLCVRLSTCAINCEVLAFAKSIFFRLTLMLFRSTLCDEPVVFAHLQYLLPSTAAVASVPTLLKLSNSFEEFLLREVMMESSLNVQLQTRVLACAELLPASINSFKVTVNQLGIMLACDNII